jgi:hypothetical protein
MMSVYTKVAFNPIFGCTHTVLASQNLAIFGSLLYNSQPVVITVQMPNTCAGCVDHLPHLCFDDVYDALATHCLVVMPVVSHNQKAHDVM